MSFDLHVDAARWRRHLTGVVESTPGIVPVVKGNGYGLGRDQLAFETTALECTALAVGTYNEVQDALIAFGGDVMVLSPWRPFRSRQSARSVPISSPPFGSFVSQFALSRSRGVASSPALSRIRLDLFESSRRSSSGTPTMVNDRPDRSSVKPSRSS